MNQPNPGPGPGPGPGPAPGAPAAQVSLIDRIEPMIKLTEMLTRLIADQASAFEARRPQDAAATMEETVKLANVYRHEATRFRAGRAELAKAPVALRQRLTRATEAFDAVMARQERALHGAKTVTEGLVKAIAEEVASQRTASTGYGANGRRAEIPAGVISAIALNKRA